VWARLVVITRIFGLNIDGKKTDGLVAYADMLNHKRPREDESGDVRVFVCAFMLLLQLFTTWALPHFDIVRVVRPCRPNGRTTKR